MLRCPANSKRDSQGAGYVTPGLLEGFDMIDCFPTKMNLACFDDGDDS